MSEQICTTCGADLEKRTLYCIDCYSKLEKRILVLERAMIKLAFRNTEEEYFTDDEVIELCTDQAEAELQKEGKI